MRTGGPLLYSDVMRSANPRSQPIGNERATPTPRTRRSTAEVQRLILEAATGVFGRKGYGQTTTDDIAAEAGVARSVMFRHFTSKAELFRAAQLQPFIDLVTTFSEPLHAPADTPRHEYRSIRPLAAI